MLDEQFPDWPSKRIHEIAPGGAASDRLRRRCPGYSYSFHGVPGEPFEDVMALSFPDESIDLFVTQDVLEHITRPADAFREIARVLRPGGAHVFTVPIYERTATVVRVAEDGTEVMPADYHEGTEGKSLVVREWGRDITDYIDLASDVTSEMHRRESRRHGIEGEFLEVVVSRKPL